MPIARLFRWTAAVCLLGWAVNASCASPSPLNEPAFETIGDAASIPDGVVTCLAEGRDGLIWIGTTAGLLRYDGYQFRRFTRSADDPHSISGNLVRALHVGADGRVWIGTDVDGLSVYEPQSGRFLRFRHDPNNPHSISDGGLFALAEDRDGRVWIGSRGGGLNRLDPESGRVEHFAGTTVEGQRPLGDEINALMIDRGGRLWIGHDNGLALRDPDTGKLQAVFSDPTQIDGLADRRVYSLFQAQDGTVWVGTREGGLVLIDPNLQGRRVVLPGPIEAGGTASIFSFAQVAPDRIWLGRTNGIDIRGNDGRLLRRVHHDPRLTTSLDGNDIRALLRDRSGGLWAAGFGSGLQRHDPNNRGVRVLRHQPGEDAELFDPNINAVLQSVEGDYWLGTRGSGLMVLDSQFRLKRRIVPDASSVGALSAGWITGLAQTADGAIWVGSRDGLHRYDAASDRFRLFHAAEGLHSPSVRRLYVDANNMLWAGTNDGAFRIDPHTFAIERLHLGDDSPLARDVNAFDSGPDGALWLGGALGLFRRPPGEDRLEPVIDPAGRLPPRLSVVGLLVDARGWLWVDTSEGLFLRRGTQTDLPFEAISEHFGLVAESVGANLLDDAEGRIWTYQYVFDLEQDSHYRLGQADGLDFGTPWFRAYTRSSSGALLFGGSQGLLVITPEQFQPWRYQPPLVLTDLRIDGQVKRLPGDGTGLQLLPGQRSFAIEFAALDYSAPKLLNYRFRLIDYDNEWIPAESGYRVASYANLWPGEYTLVVQGSNRVGAWSTEELRLPVRVLPTFWQTGWFAALCLLAMTGLLVAIVRLRTRQIRRRSEQLQSLVEQRTLELRRAKDHAEAALEQLQGTQQQLVAAEKMASLGQLVAGVAHEINTPIGIALTAASHLDDVTLEQERKLAAGQLRRSELDAWRETTQEAMRLILGSLQRAHTLIASFKQVAVDQTSEQRRTLQLDQFLDEVRSALQPSYRKGGHTIDIDCPEGIALDTYPGALFQILTNLITNAVNHAFEDGQRGHMTIQARRSDSWVQLRFRDDGRGMSAEVAARAFEPFFTTRRGSGGSGLGLHLVYNLTTQLLGGRIRLHSEHGHGCEFTLEFPAVAPRAPEHQTSPG